VYQQLPPLMVSVKSANGAWPSLFYIGFIIMKLNTKLILSFNQKLSLKVVEVSRHHTCTQM
jgi:hypothetical protein